MRQVTQPSVPPTAQVEVYGGQSSYAFGVASGLGDTASGNTFRARPTSGWGFPVGAAAWFGTGLSDGSFAFGTMTFELAQAKKTMAQTSVCIYNPTTGALQVIAVPTTLGFTQPPNSDGVTSGATIDDLVTVTLSGTEYLFAVCSVPYGGWRISTYGLAPTVIGMKKTGGVWAIDPAKTWTADQLAVSSVAGAAAYPSTTNSYGETYHQDLAGVEIEVTPVSNHLILSRYYYRSGHYSGSLVAIDPSTGTVAGWYEIPDVTDYNSVQLEVSSRAISADPTGIAGDERLICTPDVFIRSSGDSYGRSAILDLSYDGAGNFVLKSNPIAPYYPPGQGFTYAYNLTGFDPATGNLYCPTHVGGGFNSHELHVFAKTGNGWPTLDGTGPSANWWTNQWGAAANDTQADFRLGSFSQSPGIDQSVNWDSARSRILVLNRSGTLVGATVDAVLADGSEKIGNDGSGGSTLGWSGYASTATITSVVDADFSGGHALSVTATSAGVSAGGAFAINAPHLVTPRRCYRVLGYVKATTTARSCRVGVIWRDAAGSLITATYGPSVADTTTGTTYLEGLLVAPDDAVTGHAVVEVISAALSEVHRTAGISWKEQPGTATAQISTRRTELANGTSTQHNKGAIVNDRLYATLSTRETAIVPFVPLPPYPLNQWVTSIDLSAV